MPAISRPIQYYTQDSLNFNASRKKLFGEIYSKEDVLRQDEGLVPCNQTASGSRRPMSVLIYVAIAALSLTSLALFAVAIPLWERNFEHIRSPARGDWTDGLILLPLSISSISAISIAMAIVRRRRRRHRRLQAFDRTASVMSDQYRPASRRSHALESSISRSFHLMLLSSTILLLLAPLLILASTNSLSRAFRSRPASSAGTSHDQDDSKTYAACNLSNVLTKPCIPILYRIGELQIGGAATAGVTCSLWIALLVIASHRFFKLKAEERTRRLRRRREKATRREARGVARQEARKLHEASPGGRGPEKPERRWLPTDGKERITTTEQDPDLMRERQRQSSVHASKQAGIGAAIIPTADARTYKQPMPPLQRLTNSNQPGSTLFIPSPNPRQNRHDDVAVLNHRDNDNRNIIGSSSMPVAQARTSFLYPRHRGYEVRASEQIFDIRPPPRIFAVH